MSRAEALAILMPLVISGPPRCWATSPRTSWGPQCSFSCIPRTDPSCWPSTKRVSSFHPALPSGCLQGFLTAVLVIVSFSALASWISGGGRLQGAPQPYLALPPTDPHLISHSLQSCSWLASPLTTPLSASAPGMGSTSPWTPAGLASCTPGAARWPLCWAATKYARKWVVPWRAGQCGGGRAQLILPTPQGAPE